MSPRDTINTYVNVQTTEQVLVWKRYMLKRENSLPNWLIEKSIGFFFVSMFVCWLAWGHVPQYDLIFTTTISVILFFLVGKSMSNKFSLLGEKKFLRSIFTVGLLLRLIWISYMFFIFYPGSYGTNYGDGADTIWFMNFGKDLSFWLGGVSTHSLLEIIDLNKAAIDDVAYPLILGIEYLLTGGISDVFIPYVVKSILGAYCAVYMYRVAKRHFGESTARIAAIFVCLNPNIIYWSGTMMKEAEMVFFCCLAIDKFDEALSSNSQLTFKSLLPGIMSAFVLLFMRMTLGLVVIFAFLGHILLTSNKIISIGKKIVVGILMAIVLAISVGDMLMEQTQSYLTKAQSNHQKINMEWRSTRTGGNSFAKYAGAAVFAPLIFTIPFPTFNQAYDLQLLQMQLSGGCYIKNILSFFVIIILFQLLFGKWRQHIFIIAYTIGYLIVLVFSEFAQSGRFHMPVLPILMTFAAYGIQVAKTNKRMQVWFNYVLYLEVIICLAWNWFKLAGRGMV